MFPTASSLYADVNYFALYITLYSTALCISVKMLNTVSSNPSQSIILLL